MLLQTTQQSPSVSQAWQGSVTVISGGHAKPAASTRGGVVWTRSRVGMCRTIRNLNHEVKFYLTAPCSARSRASSAKAGP